MTDPGDTAEGNQSAPAGVPPRPARDPAAAARRREDWKEKSHKPAAFVAGLASGTIGTSFIGANLSAAQYNCYKLLGNQPDGPLCPYVTAPGFEVTPVALIFGVILAGVGYAAVYAVVYLGNAARG